MNCNSQGRIKKFSYSGRSLMCIVVKRKSKSTDINTQSGAFCPFVPYFKQAEQSSIYGRMAGYAPLVDDQSILIELKFTIVQILTSLFSKTTNSFTDVCTKKYDIFSNMILV